MEVSDQVAPGAFGRLLRYWRQVRRLSQEDVALEIDSSIKHISFLENGRSLPSREITLSLASFFRLNSWETNYLLAAAGMAPVQSIKPNSAEAEFLENSLAAVMQGNDPFPSLIINRFGDVHMLNKAWLEVIGNRVPSLANASRFNLLDMIMSDDGLSLFMEDWEDNICTLLVFLQQEVLLYQDRSSIETLQRYLNDSRIPRDWKARGAHRLTTAGLYTRITIPGSDPSLYMQVFNTVGLSRFMPEPVLMIYNIYPVDWSVTEQWRQRMEGKSYSHPLLKY